MWYKKMRLKIRFNPKRVTKKVIVFISVLSSLFFVGGYYFYVSSVWNGLYDKKSFNCVDMSYVLGCYFKNIGIPTQMVYGHNPSNPVGHCWLLLFGCIEFESTTLYPVFWNKNCDRYHVDVVEDVV